MDKNTVRQLKIKTSALKRYAYFTFVNINILRNQKDYNSYAKENQTLEEKLKTL